MHLKLKLATRINLLGISLIVLFTLTLIWMGFELHQNLYQARYQQMKAVVATAYNVLSHFADAARQERISEAEAREMAKSVIRDLRHSQNEYFFILDLDHNMIMHPIESTGLEGTNTADLTDARGKKIAMAMVQTARETGGGVVDYYWPKPGSDVAVPKISYASLFPEWEWVLCSGIYIDDVAREVNGILLSAGVGVGGIILFAVLFTGLITRSIVRPIRRVAVSLVDGGTAVAAAADELAATSQTLSQNASEQAAAVEETSAAMERMREESHETTRITKGAQDLMNENISQSGHSLKALIDLTREMAQVEAEGGRMSKIISTIDAIAFQTDLLALNAAVEAARAGEAGAGFAVVAEEVRKLAAKSTEAARDTQSLLESTITRVTQAAGSIRHLNADFEGIIESATRMGEKTEAITIAARDQAHGIAEVTTAIREVDTVTQDIAASAQETAASSQSLSARASQLRRLSGDLSILVGKSRKPS